MRRVWFFLRWGPLAAGALWWFGQRPTEPWYAGLCLVIAALTPRSLTFSGWLKLPAAVGSWMLGAPWWAVVAAAGYRMLYETPLSDMTGRFMMDPVRALKLTPALKCPHGEGFRVAVRRADSDMEEGRTATALDSYLHLLAEHPRPYTDLCVRVLLTRAAEAAVRGGCPQLAAELAAGALWEVEERPVAQVAVLVARVGALRAQALRELGDQEGAAAALRSAQNIHQTDSRADELVRTVAVAVHLSGRRPGTTLDQELDTAAELLRKQELSPENPRVMVALHMVIGERLMRSGHLIEAKQAFSVACWQTGVDVRTAGDDSAFEAWTHRIGPRWRGAVHLWLTAIHEQMRAHAVNGHPVNSLLLGTYTYAVALAPACENPLLTAGLTTGLARLEPGDGSTEAARAKVRQLMETRPFVFADQAAQGSWAHLLAPDTADDLSWWTLCGDPKALTAAARGAEVLFARLNEAAPHVFGAMYRRVLGTSDMLTALLGTTAPNRAPGGAPRRPVRIPPLVAAPLARAYAADEVGKAEKSGKSERGSKAAGKDKADERADMGDRIAAALARTGAPLALAVSQRQRRTAAPPWLDDAERITGGRSWTVLTAAVEAHLLGHGRIGPEHLLLSVVDDQECAGLLAPFGVSRRSVRRAVTDVLGPDRQGPAAGDLSSRAREVLGWARREADRYEEGRLRPVHLLVALLLQETGIPVALLAALGVDTGEVLAGARHRLYADHRRAASDPFVWTRGLPHPHLFTARACGALREAARAAGPAGLLGLTELAGAVAAHGVRVRAACAMPLPEAVTVTYSGRRALDLAVSTARLLGHPGVDLDHISQAVELMTERAAATAAGQAPVVPPCDDSLAAALRTASALAHGEGHPCVTPEHLAAALAAPAPRPAPEIPLPLTPASKRALTAARARAAALDRPVHDTDDLRHALAARQGPIRLPDPDPHTDTDAAAGAGAPTKGASDAATDPDPAVVVSPPLPDSGFAWILRRAREQCEKPGSERVSGQRVEVLRLLTRTDAHRYEAVLIEALMATAQRLGPGPVAMASLAEAASRARGIRARTPGAAGSLTFARTSAEIGFRLGRMAGETAAAPHLDQAVAALRGMATAAEYDAESDELLGTVLLYRAEGLAARRTPSAPAAVREAAGHRLTAAAEGDDTSGAALVRPALFAIDQLIRLDEPEQALAVATRTLKIRALPGPQGITVRFWRVTLLYDLGRDDLGLGELNDIVRLEPDDPYPLVRRGHLLLRIRRTEEAIADFRAASALAPEYVAPRRRLGQALVQAARFADALQVLDPEASPLLEQPLLCGPEHASTLLAHARALRGSGRAGDALGSVRIAYSCEPEVPWYRYQFGLSLHTVGAVRETRSQFGEAIRLETAGLPATGPWHGISAGNLAVYCAALGGVRQSHAWLRRALEATRHPWVTEGLREDLRELSRAVPARAGLVGELLVASDKYRH